MNLEKECDHHIINKNEKDFCKNCGSICLNKVYIINN